MFAPERTVPARLSRREREDARVRRAAAAAKAAGKSAMAVALAEIETAFDAAAAVSDFKLRVERLMQLGPHHPAVRARFGARAERIARCDLDGAIVTVERWQRDERKAFQIASALGGGIRLSLEVLRELRLILRLMRFKRMQLEYESAVMALTRPPMGIAAE